MRDDAGELSLRVNGEEMSLPIGATVEDVVLRLDQDPRLVAVEWGGRIVPRAEYGTTVLESGARLEVVRFVQGG
jgi:sulfur carrier protein